MIKFFWHDNNHILSCSEEAEVESGGSGSKEKNGRAVLSCSSALCLWYVLFFSFCLFISAFRSLPHLSLTGRRFPKKTFSLFFLYFSYPDQSGKAPPFINHKFAKKMYAGSSLFSRFTVLGKWRVFQDSGVACVWRIEKCRCLLPAFESFYVFVLKIMQIIYLRKVQQSLPKLRRGPSFWYRYR